LIKFYRSYYNNNFGVFYAPHIIGLHTAPHVGSIIDRACDCVLHHLHHIQVSGDTSRLAKAGIEA